MPFVKDARSLWFALLMIAISGAGLWLSSDLRVGTAMRMGPGYVPMALSWCGLAFGAMLLVRALSVAGPGVGAIAWRPLLAVTAAVAAFMAIERLGLVAAILAVTLISCIGDRETRWVQSFALAVLLAAFASLVFVKGLGLPMPLWPAGLSL
jgi:hypothetical protein